MLDVRSDVDSNNKSNICCSFRGVWYLFFRKLIFFHKHMLIQNYIKIERPGKSSFGTNFQKSTNYSEEICDFKDNFSAKKVFSAE